MTGKKSYFRTRTGFIITGIIIGAAASILQKLGNPANMGICVACFIRDISGALGLHRAAVVQYIRPEIIGFVLGSLVAALAFREFKPGSGSSSMIKFTLGFFAMIGSLMFLGCSWRALFRLAGGDWNAVTGIIGLIAGVRIGIYFRQSGFDLGKRIEKRSVAAWIIPGFMFALLLLLLVKPELPTGAPFSSESGPGAMRAPVFASIGIGLFIGFIAQRTRFCTIGAVRSVFFREFNMFFTLISILISAFIFNLIFSQFNPGFAGQPIAHTNHIWNFFGMLLAGLAFVLGGGCPGRQLILSGEGDVDAAIFVIGMFAGAAFSHNFAMASTPAGTTPWGPASVIIGIIVCLALGFTIRKKV